MGFVDELVSAVLQCFDAVGWVAWRASGLYKTWVVGSWHGYLSGARCMAQLMPLLQTVSCFSKIQIGFTFLVPAHPGSPGKGAVKRVCVCGICCSSWRPAHSVKALKTWHNITLQIIFHIDKLNSYTAMQSNPIWRPLVNSQMPGLSDWKQA